PVGAWHTGASRSGGRGRTARIGQGWSPGQTGRRHCLRRSGIRAGTRQGIAAIFAASLSNSLAIASIATWAALPDAELKAGRMKGWARAWLVPNSINLQWVVLPPGAPLSPLVGRAPPRMPTRIMGPP